MSQNHWEAYYRSGALISCPTNPEPYYTMEVRDAWVTFFSMLADGDRVLDLGTGNGPVALIAKETATERSLSIAIDGVDLAMIDPVQDVPDGHELLGGINFHPGVSTEDLPFDDASFAAISGQYIIEYTNLERTLAECRRVLAPGGSCQFILHGPDSVIVQNGSESLRHAGLVQEDTKLMRKFRRYYDRSLESPGKAEKARQQLLDAGKELEAVARTSGNPHLIKYMLDNIGALLQNRTKLSRGQMLQQSERLERELKNWVRRLQDLVSAAQSENDLLRIVRIAEELGFDEVRFEQQMQGGDNLIGWRLTMTLEH